MKKFTNLLVLLIFITSLVTASTACIGWWLGRGSPAGLITGAFLGTVLSTILSFLALTPVRAGMEQLLDCTERAVQGDLTRSIAKKNYRWGDFHRLVINVSKVLKGVHKWFALVRDTSTTLDRASEQIISGTEQVSSGSQDQASQVQHLLTSIEDLSTYTSQSAKDGKEASELAFDTEYSARQGGEKVDRLVMGMGEIEKNMSSLAESAQQIDHFLSVIQNIASETNLLALNAAIEAARAGENGKGFAVVADEIRKLANQSEKATGEVSQLTEAIQKAVEEAVDSVNAGVKLSRSAGEEFTSIVQLVEKTTAMVKDIANKAESQAETTSSMLNSAESISSVAQEAAASSEETSAVAQELTGTAEELKKVADIWKFN